MRGRRVNKWSKIVHVVYGWPPHGNVPKPFEKCSKVFLDKLPTFICLQPIRNFFEHLGKLFIVPGLFARFLEHSSIPKFFFKFPHNFQKAIKTIVVKH